MKQTDSHEELSRQTKQDFDKYSSLPMAVYITSVDGTIIMCNEDGMKLLDLNPSDLGRAEITKFYHYKKERDYIIKNLSQIPEGQWEKNQTLEYDIKGTKKSLRFFAKPYFDALGKLKGSLCLVFEIKEFERFREMEDSLSAGIFEIVEEGNEGIITYSNMSFKKLLEIPDHAEVNKASDFFSNKEDVKNIVTQLRDDLNLKNNPIDGTTFKRERVRIKRYDGSTMIATLNLIPEIFENGKIKKLKGVIEDFTAKNILEEVPIGLYLIKEEENFDRIISANDSFAGIHGLRNAKECEGLDIAQFHSNKQKLAEFKQKLHEADANGKLLRDFVIKIKTAYGKEKEVAVTAKIIRDSKGKIFGRVGAIYDFTEEVEIAFSEKKNDYAKFLHSYSAMLDNVKLTLGSIIALHGSDIFNSKYDINLDKAIAKLHIALNAFINSLKKYLQELIANNEIETKTVERIDYYLGRIWENKNSFPKQQASWIRTNIKFIKQLLPPKPELLKIRKEVYKQFQRDISEVFRFAKVISLQILKTEAREMDWELIQFRYSLTDSKRLQKGEDFGILETLDKAVSALSEYSAIRNIEVIKKNFGNEEYFIFGNERDLYNSFFNVIHNAIKYSWYKRKESDAWITIEIFETKDGFIQISFENWGVPIREQEISSGAIWDFSYRGASSIDKERQGSGIGLNHTKENVISLGGEINIESDQATFNHTNIYDNAFLTKLTIKLPIKKQS